MMEMDNTTAKVIAGLTALSTLLMGVWTWWQNEKHKKKEQAQESKKHSLELKQSEQELRAKDQEGKERELNYEFTRYQRQINQMNEYVTTIKGEYGANAERMPKLEQEHLKCREENARLDERVRERDTRICDLENRVGELENLLAGK